jgi:hypothetical protein
MMVLRIAGTDPRQLQRIAPADLIVRGSTGPAPKPGGDPWDQ